MKKIFFLLIAALLVGTTVFTLFYRVFNTSFTDSLIIAGTAVLSDVIVSRFSPYFERLDKHQKDRITRRVKRGLSRMGRRTAGSH